MSDTYNNVTLIARIGFDPEIKTLQEGDRIAILKVVTNETWKDKKTGERKQRAEWHKVVIYNTPIVETVEKYAKKGTLVHIQGMLRTRKRLADDGHTIYEKEIVMLPYQGVFQMLSRPKDNTGGADTNTPSPSTYSEDIGALTSDNNGGVR